ncbi:hypothetical protein HY249_02765, partial [Candidatus Azambacteria bacterium]|nr:hypothetical protein [Candidatus Azambacteria bacterium]
RIKTKNKTNAVIFSLAVFSLSVFFFAVFQVLEINDLRYEKSSKISRLKSMEGESEKLELSLAKLKKSQNLKESAIGLDMTDVLQVSYVGVGGGDDVAFNR